jgi:hypothetical protein
VPVVALERGGSHPRESSALERGGPRPRGVQPSSEADLARGGDWANCLGGARGPLGLQLCRACFGFAGLFAFAFSFFTKENGFPRSF